MKVTTWVDLGSKEIEVEITGAEAAAAILADAESGPPDYVVRRLSSNFLTVMKKLPDEAFTSQSSPTKVILVAELESLIARLKA